jgi:hypothetical protein
MFTSLNSLFYVILTRMPPRVLSSTVLCACGNKVYIIPDHFFSQDRF